MSTTLRAFSLIIIVGVVATVVWLFATDPVEAPHRAETSNNMSLSLTSEVFSNDGKIPSRYTCDGDNVSPPLTIGDVPVGTKSFALIVDDHDVPTQVKSDGVFDHWVLFNISPETRSIAVDTAPGIRGSNGRGDFKYTGPCPPTEYEPTEHRYVFKLFALDTMLNLSQGASKAAVLGALSGHEKATATLTGRYDRANK